MFIILSLIIGTNLSPKWTSSIKNITKCKKKSLIPLELNSPATTKAFSVFLDLCLYFRGIHVFSRWYMTHLALESSVHADICWLVHGSMGSLFTDPCSKSPGQLSFLATQASDSVGLSCTFMPGLRTETSFYCFHAILWQGTSPGAYLCLYVSCSLICNFITSMGLWSKKRGKYPHLFSVS